MTDVGTRIMQTDLMRLPRYARLGIAAALAAVLVLGFRLSWLGPRLRELEAKRAALAGKEAELMRARREGAALARERERVDELALGLDRLGATPPAPEEVSALLRRLQIFAVQSDLTIRAFRPQAASQQDLHAEWSYRLHVDGTYEGLARFFGRVAELPRIITIDDVVIRAASSPEPDRTIAAECTATAFVPFDPARPGGREPGEAR